MFSQTNQPLSQPSGGKRPEREAIVVESHPGGRFPGKLLPPTWFTRAMPRLIVPAVLPDPTDHAGIVEGVVAMCSAVRDAARRAYDAGKHPLLIGGDHSIAMGSIAAATSRHRRVAVIWVDAHADFNTMETSPSGNPHGMPLAAACGLGDERLTSLFEHFVNPVDVVLIGARDIDPDEARLLAAHGIWHVEVPRLRELGIPALVEAIAERFGNASVHLSFDFDALSSEHFLATGTPVPDGLTPDEGEALLASIAHSGMNVVSSDWVEYLPEHAHAEPSGALARRMFDAFHGAP